MNRESRRAFTLIEMMVVLVVIAILVSIAFMVGRSVQETQRARTTEALIRTLDQTLSSYQIEHPGAFPSYFTDAQGRAYPIVDGRLTTTGGSNTAPAYPSLALYLLVVRRDPGIDRMITAMDTSNHAPVDFATAAPGVPIPEEAVPGGGSTRPINLVTINDAWGRPIRFVHPGFDGPAGPVYRQMSAGGPSAAATFSSVNRDLFQITFDTGTLTFRRSAQPFDPSDSAYRTDWIGDADEGYCVGEKPYFYSAGADGNPGSRKDNIYSVQPNFSADAVKAGN